MKNKFSKIILVIVLTMFGMVNVKADSELICSYDLGNYQTLKVKFNVNNRWATINNINDIKASSNKIDEGRIETFYWFYYMTGSRLTTNDTCPDVYYESTINENGVNILLNDPNLPIDPEAKISNGKKVDSFDDPITKPGNPENPGTPKSLDCVYYISRALKQQGKGIEENVLAELLLSFTDNVLVSANLTDNNKPWKLNYIQGVKSTSGDTCPTIYIYGDNFDYTLCIDVDKTNLCPSNSVAVSAGSIRDEDGEYSHLPGFDWNYDDITNEGSMTCEELLGPKGVNLLRTAFLLIKIAAPIIFIALSTVDFAGALMSDNPEGERNHAFRKMIIRAVACILLFMLPYLVKVLFAIIGVIDTDTCGIW